MIQRIEIRPEQAFELFKRQRDLQAAQGALTATVDVLTAGIVEDAVIVGADIKGWIEVEVPE